ncbi:FAD-binding oxidoreductase [Streptomyces roseicoloratus]|uniref:FAD-binding oxidoreductase n=1 Tax=Streptomyces roseicoloratus TaxID=2508722 RepID=A0ABY9RUV2_9ACTN|nr:FAD-binding oxidoreductase [Streptomyces roseicoloratus]WMX45722.1 FAD-binding oxidoreductase [Streptomyces roseicoloratus]
MALRPQHSVIPSSAPAPARSALPDSAVARLVAEVKGEVFRPGDPGYAAELDGFNLIGRHRPALVVGAVTAEDVAAAVRFGAGLGLAVGVHATGHGIAAPDEDAVLVTTRRMNAVAVDPVARIARVEAGARWHQVVATAAYHGLAPLNGSSPLVGVVGYTLGGGLGPLGRLYGYAADHVTRVHLVTADGRHRTVTAASDAELFWALRGGKGNFGIVTALEFGLVPVTRLYGGGLSFPGAEAAAVLDAWRTWTAGLPETLTSSVALLRPPALHHVPDHPAGELAVHVRIAFTGTWEDGEELLRPLRAAGTLLADTVADMPYSAVAEIHQDPTEPLPYHERNIVLREFDEGALAALLAAAGPGSGCTDPMVELRHLGGALSRPPAVPNAVGRDGAFTLSTLSLPGSPDVVLDRLAAWSTGRRYLNFLAGPDTSRSAAECFDPETLARLLRAKRRHDPENVFRLGHALLPEPA